MSGKASPIGVAVVGVGKIARDQHLPVIATDPTFRLVAAASRHGRVEGVTTYATLGELLPAEPDAEAISLCTPPQQRHALAVEALRAGRHVMLEKPPGATLSEVEDLRAQAAERGLTLFATWHSRFAAAVEPARAWLADKRIARVEIDWREDVRHWHPGQAWIWEPGGLGVFDPGINALSIATRVLPRPFFLTEGELRFPANRAAPIAAELAFTDALGTPIAVFLDWLQTGPQTWDVRVETDGGVLVLSHGGAQMSVDGRPVHAAVEGDLHGEYAGLYRRFAMLIAKGRSDVDVSPLRHAADAFLLGRRLEVEPFED